jgi:hypothetical protein
MAKKYDEKPSNINPGPGSYKKLELLDNHHRTFAKSSRDNALIVKE